MAKKPPVPLTFQPVPSGATTSKHPSWQDSYYTNTGLLDAKGQPITAPMTGAQFISNLMAQNKLPNNNISTITRGLAALDNYKLSEVPGQTSVGTPDAQAAANYLSKINLQRAGTAPVDVLGTINNDIKLKAPKGTGPNGEVLPTDISGLAINTTRTSTSFDQPNVNASQKVVNDVFTGLLGRAATQKELQQYGQAYTNYAAQNPTNVGSGTTNYQVVGPTQRLLKSNITDTSTSNNLSEQAFVENQLKATQAYSTAEGGNYFDSMMKTLQGNARSQV